MIIHFYGIFQGAKLSRMIKKIPIGKVLLITVLTLTGSVIVFMTPPQVTEGDVAGITTQPQVRNGNYIVVHLDTMNLELKNGTTTIATLPVLSQGKPGSYYETMGGVYNSDYKDPLHFSSIGHVYMPYSVHVFGNYFIHGIPYYPNGSPVSSTYSGGCIRLSNENAKIVYDFIASGTPIIITRDTQYSFDPTPSLVGSSSLMASIQMTNLMTASISLEALTQDNTIVDTDGYHMTTRKTILPRLLIEGDTLVAKLYAEDMGEDAFVSLMNQKAQALGLTNTHFNDLTSPVTTSYEDLTRFMTYISTYKSYLRTVTQ